MKTLLMLLVLFTASLGACESLHVNEVQDFHWVVVLPNGCRLEGNSTACTIDAAYAVTVLELVRLSRAEAFDDELDLVIEIGWKGRAFRRCRTILRHPRVLRRGPDREHEAPRGPHAYPQAHHR